MLNKNTTLLPYILQTLSEKPEFCDTYENLCEEIEDILSKQKRKSNYGNTRAAIENALKVGQNLGILTLTDDLIRVLFNYNKTPKCPTAYNTSKN